MFALGFIVSTCYIPGWTGASLPTQWAVLSALLPLGLWRPAIFGPGHWLGLASLGWASASFFWTPNFHDWFFGLWLALLWAGGFWLGSTLPDFGRLYRGFAIGLTVSSAVAIAQWLGYSPVLTFIGDPANPNTPGLFFNPTVLGATTALIALALIERRLWLYLPGLAPAFWLAHSRGAWVALIVALLARVAHWSIAIFLLALGAAYFAYNPSPSDFQRLYLWGLALTHSDLYGSGIGSFESFLYLATDLLFHSPVRMVRPEYVHNDYLQLWFELGIGAVPIYAIYAITLRYGGLVSIGAATLALFYFPLWCPTTAFLTSLAAGHAVARWHLLGSPGFSWGPDSLLRTILRRAEPPTPRPIDLPVQSPP